jgi:pimeloyl-ACP methyl ester carboxylesterase
MKSFITPLIVALILLCSLVNGQNTFTQISHYTPDEPDTSLPMPPITTLDTNEYKLVYWIHGIGGNVDSWNRTREATEDQTGHPIVGYPERKTIGLTVDYSNQQTLTMIGLSRWVNNNQIKSFINNNGLDTVDHDRSFAITHSMGGIVARGMRHNHLNMTLPVDSMKFGGMATFGAPHGGAQIINSIQQTNDGVNDWLQQGCELLNRCRISKFYQQATLVG